MYVKLLANCGLIFNYANTYYCIGAVRETRNQTLNHFINLSL